MQNKIMHFLRAFKKEGSEIRKKGTMYPFHP
jgi:hypothetical protein